MSTGGRSILETTDQLLSSQITPANSVGESHITTDMESINPPVLKRSIGDLPVSQPVIPQTGTAQSSSDATVPRVPH